MSVEWLWNGCGITLKCMESIWNIPEIYGVHMEWVWNEYGISLKCMESIWNGGGMDGPCGTVHVE